MTLSTLQLPFNSFPDEIRPVLAVVQDGLNPVEGSGREPGLHILGPHFFPSHVDFSHMRY